MCHLLCVWAQLPAQIELNTLAEDGNKIKTTVGDVVKGKKVIFPSTLIVWLRLSVGLSLESAVACVHQCL